MAGKSGGSGRAAQGGRPYDLGHLDHLAGGGGSRTGEAGATRAREVSRPTPADLARAERTVVLKRAYRPPAS